MRCFSCREGVVCALFRDSHSYLIPHDRGSAERTHFVGSGSVIARWFRLAKNAQETAPHRRLTQGEAYRRESTAADAENYPTITFRSTGSKCVGTNDFRVLGDLTIRGVRRPVVLDMHYLGKWRTPYWTEAGNAGPVTRVGFVGQTRINRHDFQVSWNSDLENSGAVVGDEVLIEVDVEALLETEFQKAQQKGRVDR